VSWPKLNLERSTKYDKIERIFLLFHFFSLAFLAQNMYIMAKILILLLFKMKHKIIHFNMIWDCVFDIPILKCPFSEKRHLFEYPK